MLIAGVGSILARGINLVYYFLPKQRVRDLIARTMAPLAADEYQRAKDRFRTVNPWSSEGRRLAS